jgi:hypothetical protein
MDDAILHVGDIIKRYKSLKNIRIKFTLGKYSSEFGFERHLFHEGNYKKILDLLESCDTWDKTDKTFYEKFKSEPEKIVNSAVILCKNGPYDVLLTVETKKNSEIFVSEEFNMTSLTFKKKYHAFCLNYCETTLDEKYYTFNIVPDFPKDHTDTYISHSSLLKIQDVISACSETKENLIFSLLKST